MILSKKQMIKGADQSVQSTGWSAPLLFQTTEDRFSRVKAHMCQGLRFELSEK